MTPELAHLLRGAVGAERVRWENAGRLDAEPAGNEMLAALNRLALANRESVGCAGAASWQPADGPESVHISMRAFDRVLDVRPADLVLTTQAGVSIEQLHRTALDHDTWLALDPPGDPDRTIGSVLATATAGPLRQGFGGVREQVLGLTVVTGDGRVIRSGGTTVKNVAGFDLTKLHVGGFGAFGMITECHLRLRALPRADITWITPGPRDQLTGIARRLAELQIDAAAIELLSPALATGTGWVLAVRLIGGPNTVIAEGARLGQVADVTWREQTADRATALWSHAARAMTSAPVTVRLGGGVTDLDEILDLVVAQLGEGMVSAGPALGSARWSGAATIAQLRTLRTLLASREVPVTLERAPWAVRAGVGHFGAYHEGVGGLVRQLRSAFDPGNILVTPLSGDGPP